MIDRERFEALAALAVANEATVAERAELEAMLKAEPDLVDELLDLGETDQMLRRAVEPATQSPEPIPPKVLAGFDQVRRTALSARLAEAATAPDTERVVAFPQPKVQRRKLPPWLAIAASVIVLAGLTLFFRPARNSSRDIAILAPRGETGFTEPTIAWDARPGQKYDVWILPAEGNHADASRISLYTVKGVSSPIPLSALQPGPALRNSPNPPRTLAADTNYRLLVCLANAGPVAGIAVPFHTSAQAVTTPPPPSLDAVHEAASAGRPADALSLLVQLPAAERQRPETAALERDLRARILTQSPP